MYGSFVVHKIARALETFIAESTLIGFFHLVHELYVSLEGVKIGRFLSAVVADVVELFCVVIFPMASVGLQVCLEMAANFTLHSILRSPFVSLHVLFKRVHCLKRSGAYFAYLHVFMRVGAFLEVKQMQVKRFSNNQFAYDVMFQTRHVDVFFVATLDGTFTSRFNIFKHVDVEIMIANLELSDESLSTLVAFLKRKD